MPAPLLLIGLAGALALAAAASGGKKKSEKSIMVDTIRALKAEDAGRAQKAATAFEGAGDPNTAAALRNVARRVADSNAGAVLAPALALDPDNLGEHAVAEWAAIVAQAENRATVLEDWAEAFKQEGFPGIANVLQQKSDALEAGAAVPPLVLSPQEPTTDQPVTPGSETGALESDGSLNVDDDGTAAPAEPSPPAPGGVTTPPWTQVEDTENLPDPVHAGGSLIVPTNPDGSLDMKDGSTLNRDGSRTDASGVTTFPDGTKTYPTGQTKLPDGTILPSTTTKPSTGGVAPKPAGFDVQKVVSDALASGTATTIAAAAAQLESLGYKEQAAQLRARVDEIIAAQKAATPKPVASSPIAPPKPATVAVVTHTYTVKSGDNPTKIAQLFTGNGNRWKELVKANPKKAVDTKTGNFKTLSAGESLTLPTSWPASPPAATTAPVKTPAPIVVPKAQAPAVTAPAATRPATTTAPVVSVMTYVVGPGESAWAITQKLTGDGNRWHELTRANPAKALSADGNFKTLSAGEKLILPSGWGTSASTKYDTALKMTANLLKAAAGKEDVALVRTFQAQEGTAAVGTADGKYGPKSGLRVAFYGIIPAKPRYWSSATKSKDAAAYKAQMAVYAQKDPSRANQWLEAGKV